MPLCYVANLVQFKITSVSAPHPDAIDTFMHENMATLAYFEIITLLYMFCVSIPTLTSPLPTLPYLLELMLPFNMHI